MTRPLRIDVKDGWYHVSARGIERREIFDGSRDNEHFLEILKECVNRYKIKVHAYCLMDNHYHLLIQTPHANASKAMQWLNVSYSGWYNRKHQRAGHLFQGRFNSKLVDSDGAWAVEVSVYIHMNPVSISELGLGKSDKKAEGQGWKQPDTEQIKARLQSLRDYKWSSYQVYAGYTVRPKWLVCDDLWQMGRIGRKPEKESYRMQVEERLKCGMKEDVLNRIKTSLAIGAVDFVEKARKLVRGNRTEQPELRKWQRLLQFEKVIKALEQVKGESWKVFCDRRGDDGRDIALLLGRHHCGLSLRELGAAVGGAGYHAVSKAVTRTEKRAASDVKLRSVIDKTEKVLSNVET